ncbi:hypothetical protein HRI_002718300 [Hibiscus trionum]|uniref:Uncharacterized protein n=1 Tax=Hibiscus trionum TaxID=183268 RepID=A0A9W7IA75_HIBTR|nr:hypothetical protein HRI_002718300 [Hibiscus trionum]
MASSLGDTKYTEGYLSNASGQTMTLVSHEIWVGAVPPFPDIILDQGTGEFKQSADSGDGKTPGCVGGLAYEFKTDGGDELKWVVAWSNPEGTGRKVYNDLIDRPMQWSEVRSYLEKDGRPNYQTDKFGFHLEIDIPPTHRNATMKASIEAPFFKSEQGN